MSKYCPSCKQEVDLIREFGVCVPCVEAWGRSGRKQFPLEKRFCKLCKASLPLNGSDPLCYVCRLDQVELRRKEAEPFLLNWERMKAYFNYRCLRCGRKPLKLTKDHVVPKAKGGPSCLENYQPLCMACNLQKGVEIVDYRWTGWREALALSGGGGVTDQ